MTMKLLIGVDGSRYTQRLLNYIVANETLFRPDHEYVLLHAQPQACEQRGDAEHDAVLDESAHFLEAHGFSPKRVLRQGHPAEALVQTASRLQSTLVIMGWSGNSALSAEPMGSVTCEVLARSRVPVLVVH